jgi:hypothetical protein
MITCTSSSLCIIKNRKKQPSSFITLVDQQLITLPEYLSSPSVFSGVRVVHIVQLYLHVFNSALRCPLRFPGKTVFCSSLLPFVCKEFNVLFVICVYLRILVSNAIAQSLVFCVVFWNHCFPFFFWSLFYLSFFDWQILITSLISSNFSYKYYDWFGLWYLTPLLTIF